MKIIDSLNKNQFNEIKNIYADFFRSINFDNKYSNRLINSFANKKVLDIYKNQKNSKYYFCIDNNNNNNIIGFILGKIIDDIGIVCHFFVKEEYRNTNCSLLLYKNLLKWFKENNIDILEIEVNKSNSIIKNIERNNWQVVREFDDANIYQRRI